MKNDSRNTGWSTSYAASAISTASPRRSSSTSSRRKPEPAAEPLPKRNAAVAGAGYVGLSLVVLVAQHNHVTAVDIVPEKVEKINDRTPIQDDYIEKYVAEEGLDLTAALDGEAAYSQAEFVVITAAIVYEPTLEASSELVNDLAALKKRSRV